MYDLTLEHL